MGRAGQQGEEILARLVKGKSEAVGLAERHVGVVCRAAVSVSSILYLSIMAPF